MIRSRNGDLHMVYTWNKTAIRHVWLKADSASKNIGKEQNNDA
jgi:predicted neuraminidase